MNFMPGPILPPLAGEVARECGSKGGSTKEQHFVGLAPSALRAPPPQAGEEKPSRSGRRYD